MLVLGQVRFSAIRQMSRYIPEIQEEFRQRGFPIERAGKVQEITFGATAGPVQVAEQERWEYRTRNEDWSILVTEASVLLQTTAYGRFEDFVEQFDLAMRTVLEKTGHAKLGIVERLGLRYVDAIRPRPSEDFRFYLRSGLHGIADEVYQSNAQLHVQATGQTTVGGNEGVMLVRIIQNDQGLCVPPDLLAAGPQPAALDPGRLVTLVDMEHYMDGKFDPDVDWLVDRSFKLHDHLVEAFHEHVVTPAAIEVWR